MCELKVRDVFTGVLNEGSEDSSYLNTLREVREAFRGPVAESAHEVGAGDSVTRAPRAVDDAEVDFRVPGGKERGGKTCGDKVHVSVTDNGPGIAPGLTLFSEFETTKPDGMGLGLSICRSIVAANGGRLWYDASHADGARFCFVLPASRAGSAARGSRAA